MAESTLHYTTAAGHSYRLGAIDKSYGRARRPLVDMPTPSRRQSLRTRHREWAQIARDMHVRLAQFSAGSVRADRTQPKAARYQTPANVRFWSSI